MEKNYLDRLIYYRGLLVRRMKMNAAFVSDMMRDNVVTVRDKLTLDQVRFMKELPITLIRYCCFSKYIFWNNHPIIQLSGSFISFILASVYAMTHLITRSFCTADDPIFSKLRSDETAVDSD